MQIFDINHLPNLNNHLSCDVCIVGAGAAGLYLAKKLSERNISVIILEAGGYKGQMAEEVGFDTIFEEDIYRGAREGRRIGLGGSTTAWGGALVPHSVLDTQNTEDPLYGVWEYISGVVKQYADEVLSDLGAGVYDDFFRFHQTEKEFVARVLREHGFEFLSGVFLPFTRRNFSKLDHKAAIYLGAVTTGQIMFRDGREGVEVTAMKAVSKSGKSMYVSARQFVLAAGALESARIILEANNYLNLNSPVGSSSTGRFFSDHLSVAIAFVDRHEVQRTAHSFGSIFVNGLMRDFRFILKPLDTVIPRHFYHFVFDQKNPAFAVLKEALKGLQSKHLPRVQLRDVVSGTGGMLMFAWHRYLKKELYVDPSSEVRLHLDIEQFPSYTNCIKLSTKLDAYGRYSPSVQWQVRDVDIQNIDRLKKMLFERWPRNSKRFPTLASVQTENLLEKPYDVFHPVGTCRMGDDDESTVNLNLKIRGTENLFVLSTGVLPSAGTANPTFTMLCLGKKLSEYLTLRSEKRD